MNRYLLEYTSSETKNPVLSQAILETGVLVNILTADMEYMRGQMIISILGDSKAQKKLVKYLLDAGVSVKALKSSVVKDKKKCIDCLVCYGVCPTKAITVCDMKMKLDSEECIRCGQCVEVCPTRALKLE
jgi:L-aspartate semialdehyde sulfurtransferase ferredoxin